MSDKPCVFYLREGGRVEWRYEDLRSFAPLRFHAPEAMGYRGRAVAGL